MENEVRPLATVIGNYVLSRTVGVGSFGKVKLAHHKLTGHKVAVKILNKSKIELLSLHEKVIREINIMQKCNHPHIIRLYEIIDTPSDIFLVMEYVSGGELYSFINSKGKPTYDNARRFFQQMITAIEYCHFNGIAHRDIKPENLLLDAELNIKLADFGLSNVIYDGEFLKTSCGSPNYAAPELISGNLYSGSEVDIWSCGVMLYLLLIGILPFDEKDKYLLFTKIKTGDYTLPDYLDDISCDLITRMLTVDPLRRISLEDIRSHPWFLWKLPFYLSHPPEIQDEFDFKLIDFDIAHKVCLLNIPDVTPELIQFVMVRDKCTLDTNFRSIRVIYELYFDEKQRHTIKSIATTSTTINDLAPTHLKNTLLTSNNYVILKKGEKMMKIPKFQRQNILPFPGRQMSSQIQGGGLLSSTPSDPSHTTVPPTIVTGRRWYLGIQSKKDPIKIMYEVYTALLALGCCWHCIEPFRVLCVRPRIHSSNWHCDNNNNNNNSSSTSSEIEGGIETMTMMRASMSVFRVHDTIYLLDFQYIEGNCIEFMDFCSLVIEELKSGNKNNNHNHINMSNNIHSNPSVTSSSSSVV